MTADSPARFPARRLGLLAVVCAFVLAAATAPVAAAAGEPMLDGTDLFFDGLEGGNDCRWSAAEPAEAGSCSDSIQNGCETDLDCGGRSCAGCGLGLACLDEGDCLSGICYQGSCDTSYLISVVVGEGGNVTSTPAGIDCGSTCSAYFAAGTLVTFTATPNADAFFLGWSGCSSDLGCTVIVNQATTVTAHFGYSVTVSLDGTGTVTSTPAGIDCGTSCSGVFEIGSQVTLEARTTNGSDAHFSGWTGDCAAAESFRDCQLTVAAPRNTTATFSPMAWNLAFVSSVPISPTLGSADAYDSMCDHLASAAGINNVDGRGYVAFTSSASSNARDRLGNARGWVKLDGSPFGDSQARIFDEDEVFEALDLDEHGARHAAEYVMTGSWAHGGHSTENCGGWSLFSAWVDVGRTDAGSLAWAHAGDRPCTAAYAIYCLGTTRDVALAAAVTPGKKIWVSNQTFSANSVSTPDDVCAADQPGARAIVARTTAPASAVLDPGSTYVRMDGQVVGTGAEIIAGGRLQTGLWQHYDGTYLDWYEAREAWTGAVGGLETVGTSDSTCTNWTAPHQYEYGKTGVVVSVSSGWWRGYNEPCRFPNYLYCVEP